MPKSIIEAAAATPPMETQEQKRIRDLAAKNVPYTNVEVQEALKLLLEERARDISARRKPRP